MNTLKKITSITLLFSIFLLGCKQDNTTISSDIVVPVRLDDVVLSSLATTLTITGSVTPYSETELSTETSGDYILQKNPRTEEFFVLGDRVRKGEVIVVLEDEATTNTIRIETQKLNLDIAKDTYEKQKSLYEKGGVTQSDLQQAELSYINAKYDYENAQIQLSELQVVAPFDGFIVELPYYTQNTKIASGVSVVKLMDYSKLLMQVDFPEKNLPIVQKGQKASITNYNLPNDTIYATITQLSPAIDDDSRTFPGVLEIDNPALTFRPGMFVNADIVLEEKTEIIVLPKEIISNSKRGQVVYTISRNTANEKRIVTGIETDTHIEVIKGLEVGDRIVVDGYEMLSNRSKVKVLK